MTLNAPFNVKATFAVADDDDAGSQSFVLPGRVIDWLLEGKGKSTEKDKG